MGTKKQISSDGTIILKFIIPVVFYIGLILATAGLISERQYGGAAAAFLVLLTFGLLIYFGFVRLKYVSIDDQHVFISNYFKTIQIPYSDLEYVSDLSFGGNYQPIFIHFKNKTDFGYSVMFIHSTSRWFNFSEQPITKELMDKIKSSK